MSPELFVTTIVDGLSCRSAVATGKARLTTRSVRLENVFATDHMAEDCERRNRDGCPWNLHILNSALRTDIALQRPIDTRRPEQTSGETLTPLPINHHRRYN